MMDATNFEALGLTLGAVAFAFHNWLVMLAAEEGRKALGQRPRYWPRGLAKPGSEDEGDGGTFSRGF